MPVERRQDRQAAQHTKEALAMQRAFGDHAAHTFLDLRNTPAAVTARVLTAPRKQRRGG